LWASHAADLHIENTTQQIIDMSLNARGVCDTARVLRISPDTVLSELRRKEANLESVNTTLLRTVTPDAII
jgi:insertion element IS1 protein InsB